MEIFLVILLVILLAAVFGLFFFFNQKFSNFGKGDQSFLMLQERLKEMNQTMDQKLSESSRQMQGQFSQSLNVIRGVTEKVVQLQETNKQVMGFSEQLKNLEKVLTSLDQNP